MYEVVNGGLLVADFENNLVSGKVLMAVESL